jgi:XTP/dITP diphosphohydrolase
MTTLIIATRNAHKVGEIRAILGPDFRYLTLRDLPPTPAVVEDAETFAGNATKKAVELARFLAANPVPALDGDAYVLADDSGLEVDALNGAPGVHSARFAALDTGAEGNSADADNNAKLMRLMRDIPAEKRSARFRCVIALTPVPQPSAQTTSPVCAADECEIATTIFDGACEGELSAQPSGARGFGYDPLFVPNGFAQSFAELGEEVKNGISHRAKALQKLRQHFAK